MVSWKKASFQELWSDLSFVNMAISNYCSQVEGILTLQSLSTITTGSGAPLYTARKLCCKAVDQKSTSQSFHVKSLCISVITAGSWFHLWPTVPASMKHKALCHWAPAAHEAFNITRSQCTAKAAWVNLSNLATNSFYSRLYPNSDAK